MRLRHGRVSLALHTLRDEPGPVLLCLHAVGGSSSDFADAAAVWHGRVYGLDFAGHGASDPLRGGAYHPEILAGDADAALAEIGPARLAGAGVGAYVALLLAGGRPDAISAALLLPGAGLAGGGAAPDPTTDTRERWCELGPAPAGCDPAVRRLERDIRPGDYAREFAQAARRLLLAEDGTPRPPWWEGVRECPSAVRAPSERRAAIARLAQAS